MNLESAEAIGLKALAFLAEDRVRLGRPRARALQVDVELAVGEVAAGRVRHVHGEGRLADAAESLLLVFAASAGCAPAAIESARARLAAEAERRRQT
jgi:hypothetical protein